MSAGITSQYGFLYQRYIFIKTVLENIGMDKFFKYEGIDDVDVSEIEGINSVSISTDTFIQVKSGTVSRDCWAKVLGNWLLIDHNNPTYKVYFENKLSYDDEDNVVEYDDNDDVEIETYFDSEEYKKQVQAEAGKREELERQLEEQRRNKEEKRRERLEQRKEQRKRLWRTVTGKKQVIGLSSEQCQHMRYEEVFNLLKSREFYNISIVGSEDLTLDDLSQEGIVQQIIINGTDTFDESSTFPFNAKINIVYHMLKTAFPPLTSKYAKRMDVDDVVWEFENAGFQYVFREAIPDLKKGWLVKEDSVEQVTINGRTDFKKRERFRVDAKIVVSYHTFKKIR